MTFDRSDATRLAQAVYRKRQYDQERAAREAQEPDLSVPVLVELLAHVSKNEPQFSNPDITYLRTRTIYSSRFIGKMLGWFGEAVVLEALRRAVESEESSEPVFVGICRNVERERER